MDIAAMSVVMSQAKVRSDVSIALMSKVMNVNEQQGAQLTDMLKQNVTDAPHPSLGKQIDMEA